jgi:hypothetical protein
MVKYISLGVGALGCHFFASQKPDFEDNIVIRIFYVRFTERTNQDSNRRGRRVFAEDSDDEIHSGGFRYGGGV